ncbi:MAG TPA: tripartite tricarboxylate transporter TctB family protein [Paenirhodobacter sp.]
METDTVALNPPRRSAEITFAAALIVVAGAAFTAARAYPDASGTYPQALAAALGVPALLVMVRYLRGGAEDTVILTHPRRFLTGICGIGLYILGVAWIGYILPSLIFATLMPLACGYRHWPTILGTAFGTVAMVVIVFNVLLERPLPDDILAPILRFLR